MQILIDIADVNAYQKRCQDWANKYALYLLETMQKPQPHQKDLDYIGAVAPTFAQRMNAARDGFVKANPYPSLLPRDV